MATKTAVPAKVPPLNKLDLQPADWDALRDVYHAVKHGTQEKDAWDKGAPPAFRLAAQIDLDRFRDGEEYHLSWPTLLGLEPDEAPKPPAKPFGSLLAMAKAIESGGAATIVGEAAPPVVVETPAAPDLQIPTFSDAELRAISGAFMVEDAEIGEHTPDGESALAKVRAYLDAVKAHRDETLAKIAAA